MPSPKQPMFGTIRGQHPSGSPPRRLSPSDPAFRSGVFLPERRTPQLATPPSPTPIPSVPRTPRRRRAPRAPQRPTNPWRGIPRVDMDEAGRGYTT